ncbi:hypothetical protein B0H34DRAFT_793797 [Crassisporium funariophilum]|nr:hypothetical protein B0H34DRAFT_793797 [Crassisporium funariophilum]
MRFACPTASYSFIQQPSTGSQAHSHKPNPAKGKNPKRTRVDPQDPRQARAKDAAKKNEKKTKAHFRKAGVDPSHVFVGDVEPSITPQQLETFFKTCGTVSKVDIRCSRGQAITVGLAVPLAVRGPRDRQYAIVHFKEPSSARKALALNGSAIDGCKLVVCASAADLPEVQDIVLSHIGTIRQRQARSKPPKPPSANPRSVTSLRTQAADYNDDFRPLVKNDTERFIDYRDPKVDRLRIFGFSFAKCIT